MEKSLSFGVLGTGYFGRHYLRILQEIPGAELAAFSNLSNETPQGVSAPLRTSQEIIEDLSIDCVVIATPVSTHADLAEAALRAGKNVLLEKPMARSMEEAVRLQWAVHESGKILMVGHQYLYNDYVRKLKEELERGALGDIRYVLALNLYLSPIRHDIGCFWETATHELAILDYLFSPGEIADVKGKFVSFRGAKDDFAAVEVTFKKWSGTAAIIVSWFSPEKVRKMTFGGTKGMAIFDDREPKNKLKFVNSPYPGDDPKGTLFINTDPEETVIPEIGAKEPLGNQLMHFMESVRRQTPPLTDIEHGIRITSYLDTISRLVSK